MSNGISIKIQRPSFLSRVFGGMRNRLSNFLIGGDVDFSALDEKFNQLDIEILRSGEETQRDPAREKQSTGFERREDKSAYQRIPEYTPDREPGIATEAIRAFSAGNAGIKRGD